MQLKRFMSTEAEAARGARSHLIASTGEKNASKALKKAADVLNQSPLALQLRYLHTLSQIAEEKNSTIIYPLPFNLFRAFQVT